MSGPNSQINVITLSSDQYAVLIRNTYTTFSINFARNLVLLFIEGLRILQNKVFEKN